MVGQAVKRRVNSSSSAQHNGTRPSKRLQLASGSGEAADAQHPGVAQKLKQLTSWVFGGWTKSPTDTRDNTTAAMRSRTFGASMGNRIIDVTTIDDDEDEVDSSREQARRHQAREARSHLNDHVRAPPETPNVHPSLPAPLFHSSFDAPRASSSTQVGLPASLFNSRFDTPQAGPSDAATSSSSTPRPGSTVRRKERYAWAQPSSPESTSSKSSSTSGEGKSPRRRRSRHNLRGDNNREQERMLLQLIEKGEASGDPAVHAYRRVYEELLQDAEEGRQRKLLASSGNEVDEDKLQLSFDNLRLDRRVSLDEALTPSRQKPPNRLLTQRHRLPVPFESYDSLLREKLRLEKERVEQQVRARFQPAIPADVTPAQGAVVDARIRDRSFKASKGAAEVSATSLSRLKPGQWLNDEVVNFYAELINARAKATGEAVHCMNSYFYQKLSEDGYERANLKRWTKRMKIDIFALDRLLVPINLGNVHWVCAVVDLKRKRIEYYDSMTDRGQRHDAFEHLLGYLHSEHKEKKGSTFDDEGWEEAFSANSPKQDNGCDCGVFACQTLESAARGRDLVKAGFEFTRKNMPFFRRLMIVEIASGELAARPWA